MGRWKPEVPYRGKPLLYHSLLSALETQWPVILVGGYNFDKLKSMMTIFNQIYAHYRERIRIVENTDYSSGIAGSFIKAIEISTADWLFLSLGDLPNLTADTFSELYSKRKPPACRPCFNGKPGHPVLISRLIIPEILNNKKMQPYKTKERSMKDLIGSIHSIPWESDSVVTDLDYPESIETS